MEPRSFNRGDGDDQENIPHGFIASMEPRSFNRGDDGWQCYYGPGFGASMEPRSFNRGDGPVISPEIRPMAGFNGATVV